MRSVAKAAHDPKICTPGLAAVMHSTMGKKGKWIDGPGLLLHVQAGLLMTSEYEGFSVPYPGCRVECSGSTGSVASQESAECPVLGLDVDTEAAIGQCSGRTDNIR